MDGIKLTSKVSEMNLHKLLTTVFRKTKGAVFFNMDTTAEVRNGYFGRGQYGTLFLENRFTGAFGSYPNYYPHRTLRNLWMLSKYYPTSRVQMEFLNVKKNEKLYQNDPLAPAVCGIAYAFAVTMMANPLAWMEVTGLSKDSIYILKDMIAAYTKVQGDLLSGHVLPIGEEPLGINWTGFQSIHTKDTGYIQIIKERNQETSHTYHLWKLRGKTLTLHSIAGSGTQQSVTVDEEGNATFLLEGQFQYALYRYKIPE
jgi:hypothetical protein